MFFDIVKSELYNISLQTEMLEACGWDEEILSKNIEKVSNFLKKFNPSSHPDYAQITSELEENLNILIGPALTSIIIKVIIHKKEEFLSLMSLEEN